MNEYLNLAEIACDIETLGPGSRIVLWTQGCLQRCPGCISPEFQEMRPARLVRITDLVQCLCKNRRTHCGLTISGGEPLLQAGGIIALWREMRTMFPDWSLILFSGYTTDQVERKADPTECSLLKLCDVFIGGPYVEELNDGYGLRGSSNQEIRFSEGSRFSESDKKKILYFPKMQQLALVQNNILLAGIPRKKEKIQ